MKTDTIFYQLFETSPDTFFLLLGMSADLAADTLVRAVRGADKAAITGARLFDRFETKEGLSLAIEVTLQPGDKSFTDEDLRAVAERIVGAAAKLGAELRG